MPEESFYIYCIVDSTPAGPSNGAAAGFESLTGIGDRGDKVTTLQFRDLGAVVSPSPVVRYAPLSKNFLSHQLVIEVAMQDHTVLPVRFGTVAPHSDSILGILRDRYDEFAGALSEFKGKVEHGVKASWEDGIAFAEIVAENTGLRALRDRLAALPPEKTWDERRQLGQRVEEALRLKNDREAANILSALTPLCVDHRINKKFWDQMILNAAFLLDKARVDEFDRAVDALSDEHEGRAKFNYVGPVAPFNFIEITVHFHNPKSRNAVEIPIPRDEI